MYRSIVFLLLVSLLVTACSGGSRPSPSAVGTDLRSLQLSAADAPTGFYLESRHILPAAHIAGEQHLAPAEYVRHGGEAAVDETFALRRISYSGVTFLSSQVLPFRAAAGARWGFRRLAAVLDRSGTIGTVQEYIHVGATPTALPTIVKLLKHPVPPPPTRYRHISVPRIGDRDVGFTVDSAAYAGEYVLTNRLILFREGRFCGMVRIAGIYAQVPLSMALRLARKLDGRLRRAKG